jgi:putative transposase
MPAADECTPEARPGLLYLNTRLAAGYIAQMPQFRRVFQPDGTFFFTLVTHYRAPLLCTDLGRACLRQAIEECRTRWPFEIGAFVLLPDHLHAIWTLPDEDQNYPRRWSFIKRRFTQHWLDAGGREGRVTMDQHRQRRRGVWQPRFWEHTIRDQEDLNRHYDYIHFNPVKHGHASSPADWPYSSFHRFVTEGRYSADWSARQEQLESHTWLALAANAGE